MESKLWKDFLKKNKDKIRKISESNTVRNKEGVCVIGMDDPWRKETEWEEMELKKERDFLI